MQVWAIGKRTSASLKISDYTENCRCSWQYNEYLDTEMLEDLIVDIAGSSFILPSSGHTGRNGSSMVLDIIFEILIGILLIRNCAPSCNFIHDSATSFKYAR